MVHLLIRNITDEPDVIWDIPGLQHKLVIPSPPPRVQSWRDFLLWLLENPDTISDVIATVLELAAPRTDDAKLP